MPPTFGDNRAKSFLAVGTVGVIYAIDEHHVIKVPFPGDFERLAYDIETCAYAGLGHLERITHYEVREEGTQLERGTCLRGLLQSVNESSIPCRWEETEDINGDGI